MRITKITKKIFLLLFTVLIPFNFLAAKSLKNDAGNFLGNREAPNVLVEYASLSCVHCANFHNKQLPTIKKQLIDTGKLKYVYKDYPLDLPAMLAAMLSHCFKNDQYFEILNSLFRNQKKWVVASNNKIELYEKFYQILKQHGITLEKIKSCTAESDSNKLKWESILASRLEGQNLGVKSTPSFFLNGKKLEGLVDLDALLKHIY